MAGMFKCALCNASMWVVSKYVWAFEYRFIRNALSNAKWIIREIGKNCKTWRAYNFLGFRITATRFTKCNSSVMHSHNLGCFNSSVNEYRRCWVIVDNFKLWRMNVRRGNWKFTTMILKSIVEFIEIILWKSEWQIDAFRTKLILEIWHDLNVFPKYVYFIVNYE